MPTLEDKAFGLEPFEPQDHNSPRPSDYMVPLLAALTLTLLTVWSLNRCIDYSEVFVADRKYRLGIVGINCAIIVVAIIVVAYTGTRCAPPKTHP